MFRQYFSKVGQALDATNADKKLPEFVLFGDSLTEWSFGEHTQGFGLHLEQKYAGKVRIVNEDLILESTNVNMETQKYLPEFILFGASMTEWSFKEKTHGFGWVLRQTYEGKIDVLNEGQAGYTSTRLKSDFDRIISRATAPGASPTLLFTIFIGANDACFNGQTELVPWPTFSATIREYIETILTQDAMPDTKIVLITPPPINGQEPRLNDSETPEDIEEMNQWKKEGPRYRTYMSKKRYAEGLMGIAKEYEETGRVIGVDFWRGIVEAKLQEDGAGNWAELEANGMWPGCGLIGAKSFGAGWFTDGLHLDRKGYGVLSRLLMEGVCRKWPELAPEKL